MTDFTKLLDRLEPPQDGESPVRHRTGTVNAVNTDGTVDLDLGGVVVDSVAVLAGAFIAVGATVQAAVWRGDLLVLGAVRTANQGGPLGVLDYAEATANQGSIGGAFVALTGLSVTVTVPVGRQIRISAQIQVLVDVVSDTTAQLAIAADGAAIQLARYRPVGNNRAATVTSSIVVTPAAGSVTYDLRLRREVGTGTLSLVADSGNRAFILVEDLGPA